MRTSVEATSDMDLTTAASMTSSKTIADIDLRTLDPMGSQSIPDEQHVLTSIGNNMITAQSETTTDLVPMTSDVTSLQSISSESYERTSVDMLTTHSDAIPTLVSDTGTTHDSNLSSRSSLEAEIALMVTQQTTLYLNTTIRPSTVAQGNCKSI